MRIAYVSMDAGIPVFGPKGCSSHVRELCSAFVEAGHDVELFTAKPGRCTAPVPFRVQGISGDLTGSCAGARRERAQLARNGELRETLQRAHRSAAFDLVYERYSLWSDGAREAAAIERLPYLLEVNSPLRREQRDHRRLHLEDVATAIERQLFGTADVVVAVSAEVAAYVREIRGRDAGVTIVPNGVDLDLFAASPPSTGSAPFTVGFLGSLKPWHGIEVLLEAFRDLSETDPSSRLLIVGDGPLRGFVEHYVASHRLAERVELTGAVSKPLVPDLLGRMDVATAPYPRLDDFYFSPLKVFEYMAAGRAIVASRIGQVGCLLQDGRTGLLTPPGDAMRLAASVRQLQIDPAARLALGRAARREAFAHHGWPSRVRQILRTLKRRRATPIETGALATEAP